jgi:hypothetical protein
MCRGFPDPRNTSVWDLRLVNGETVRFDVSTPGWVLLYVHSTKLQYSVRNQGSVTGALRAFSDPNNSFILGTANTIFNGDNQWHTVASYHQLYQQQLAAARQAAGQVVIGGAVPQTTITMAGIGGASTAGWSTYYEKLSPEERKQWEQVTNQTVMNGVMATGRTLCNLRENRGDYDASGNRRPGSYDAAGVSHTSPCAQ